jgi:hypothetical protein
LRYAKDKNSPTLSEAAAERVAEAYVEIRSNPIEVACNGVAAVAVAVVFARPCRVGSQLL